MIPTYATINRMLGLGIPRHNLPTTKVAGALTPDTIKRSRDASTNELHTDIAAADDLTIADHPADVPACTCCTPMRTSRPTSSNCPICLAMGLTVAMDAYPADSDDAGPIPARLHCGTCNYAERDERGVNTDDRPKGWDCDPFDGAGDINHQNTRGVDERPTPRGPDSSASST